VLYQYISVGMRKTAQKCVGLTGILLIVALAFYGFYVSLGGRPVFGDVIFGE
jgi:hypothetical protein